jgi:hypothetical protein
LRFQRDVFDGAEIHPGVLQRAVRVGGKDGGGVDLLYADLHLVMIAS